MNSFGTEGNNKSKALQRKPTKCIKNDAKLARDTLPYSPKSDRLTNLMDKELTQWRVFLAVRRSPSNT